MNQKLRLLIADDEDLARYALKTLLSRSYPDLEIIAEAVDGEEAIEMAGRFNPDLVILDIRMPVRDGLDAARIIKKRLPETSVLILTAYEDFSFAQQALNTGVDGYLLKPVSPDEFAICLRTVTERRSRTVQTGEDRTEAGPVTMDLTPGSDRAVSWRLERALDFIGVHLNEDLPMDIVAAAAGVSSQHLSRLFRDELDVSFIKMITERRMVLACRLLDTTTLGIAEVADRCGFKDANYFAKVFRKNRGISPQDYRNGVGIRPPVKE